MSNNVSADQPKIDFLKDFFENVSNQFETKWFKNTVFFLVLLATITIISIALLKLFFRNFILFTKFKFIPDFINWQILSFSIIVFYSLLNIIGNRFSFNFGGWVVTFLLIVVLFFLLFMNNSSSYILLYIFFLAFKVIAVNLEKFIPVGKFLDYITKENILVVLKLIFNVSKSENLNKALGKEFSEATNQNKMFLFNKLFNDNEYRDFIAKNCQDMNIVRWLNEYDVTRQKLKTLQNQNNLSQLETELQNLKKTHQDQKESKGGIFKFMGIETKSKTQKEIEDLEKKIEKEKKKENVLVNKKYSYLQQVFGHIVWLELFEVLGLKQASKKDCSYISLFILSILTIYSTTISIIKVFFKPPKPSNKILSKKEEQKQKHKQKQAFGLKLLLSAIFITIFTTIEYFLFKHKWNIVLKNSLSFFNTVKTIENMFKTIFDEIKDESIKPDEFESDKSMFKDFSKIVNKIFTEKILFVNPLEIRENVNSLNTILNDKKIRDKLDTWLNENKILNNKIIDAFDFCKKIKILGIYDNKRALVHTLVISFIISAIFALVYNLFYQFSIAGVIYIFDTFNLISIVFLTIVFCQFMSIITSKRLMLVYFVLLVILMPLMITFFIYRPL